MELLKLGNVFNSLQYKYLLLIYYIVDHQDKNKTKEHYIMLQYKGVGHLCVKL